MVERITSAHRLGRAAFWNIVYFSHLDSRHVPIFCEARWNETDVSPPIRSRGRDGHLSGFQHQVRFADRPLIRLIEMELLGHVDWLATRCPAVHPLRDQGDLLVTQ